MENNFEFKAIDRAGKEHIIKNDSSAIREEFLVESLYTKGFRRIVGAKFQEIWRGVNISGLMFEACEWQNSVEGNYSSLRGATARGTGFINCKFTGMNFAGCDLRGATFDDCEYTDVVFVGNDMRAALLGGGKITKMTVRNNAVGGMLFMGLSVCDGFITIDNTGSLLTDEFGSEAWNNGNAGRPYQGSSNSVS